MNIETIKEHDEWVTPNSDTLHKKDIKWIESSELEPLTTYEHDMLKGTLTADELIRIENEENSKELTPEEFVKQKTKSFMNMFKIISLDEMGYKPFYDTSLFSCKQRFDYMELMKIRVQEYNDNKEEEIINRFNIICNSKIFTPSADLSIYGVGL